MFRQIVVMLLGVMLLSGVAAAQTQEVETPVERIIKAAQNMPLAEMTALQLQPRSSSALDAVYVGGQLANLIDAPLEERLIGTGQTFADGPRIESDVRIQTARLGYRYQIRSGEERDAALPLAIRSVVGLAVLDIKYQSEDLAGAQLEQGYYKGAPLLGFEMEWRATPIFSLAAEASSTLPLSNMPWLFSAQVLGRFQLAGRRDGGVRAFVGVGYEKISLEGDVINHFESNSGPTLLLGIEARF